MLQQNHLLMFSKASYTSRMSMWWCCVHFHCQLFIAGLHFAEDLFTWSLSKSLTPTQYTRAPYCLATSACKKKTREHGISPASPHSLSQQYKWPYLFYSKFMDIYIKLPICQSNYDAWRLLGLFFHLLSCLKMRTHRSASCIYILYCMFM